MPVPVFATSYTFYVSLADSLDPSSFLTNPTIATGDFMKSVDGAPFVNLTNTPFVLPPGSTTVQVTLTAAEMTGDKVAVQAIDQSGDQWQDLIATIDIPTASTETVNDIQEGDHTETSASLKIHKKGTGTVLLDKKITGSLLSPSITIRTDEVD